MSNINTTALNVSTSPLPSLNVLLAQLGFQTWQTLTITFILPPVNLISAVFCSFSLWIFLRSTFSDPIFFYYKLLCLINIIHSLHNTLIFVPFLPIYFPWIDTYVICVCKMYHTFLAVFYFHFEDVLRMAILLHKMKLFSPFVRKHFSASPQLISLSLFLTCLCIDVPLLFGLEVDSLGQYYYVDSHGVTQAGSFYYINSSQFSQTFLGKILLGIFSVFLNYILTLFIGIILNICS
jgi:hypothetical protein